MLAVCGGCLTTRDVISAGAEAVEHPPTLRGHAGHGHLSVTIVINRFIDAHTMISDLAKPKPNTYRPL